MCYHDIGHIFLHIAKRQYYFEYNVKLGEIHSKGILISPMYT